MGGEAGVEMKWHKRDADEHRKSHVVELYQRHGHKGLFFWNHLTDLLTEYFNFWCPGSYKFKTSIFYAYFHPFIKDPRFMRKMLEFLTEEKIIISSVGKSNIYMYYPAIVEQADAYTKRRLKEAEDKEEEQPESARELASLITAMQKYDASAIRRYAKEIIEFKGDKPK